ncbi:MAG TPA: PLD nuclease N-terminal domain-containing protein [Candidatus Dorea intestinavium]|nr:PLD nuclease N-terminal domain-containing protein [Candidatus Dorea intestinavium]
MEEFIQYWPFLVPLIILQLTLAIIALVHVIKHPHYRFGNKGFWIVVVLFFQFIGPLIYFVFGRGEE